MGAGRSGLLVDCLHAQAGRYVSHVTVFPGHVTGCSVDLFTPGFCILWKKVLVQMKSLMKVCACVCMCVCVCVCMRVYVCAWKLPTHPFPFLPSP